MMRRVLLRGTDLELSPIALGTVKAGIAWSGSEADRLLDMYLDLGGNVLDTARVYTPPKEGCSEQVLGEWLQSSGKRHQVVIVSKGGHPRLDSMTVPRMDAASMSADLEASLRALHVDEIDLYLYHRDAPGMPVGMLLEQMESFRRAGKIRWYGCSNWTTARMEEAAVYAKTHHLTGFVANECLYNIGVRHMGPLTDKTMVAADEAMLAYHRATGMGMLAYCGLCSGYFHRLAAEGPKAVQGKKYDTPGNRLVAECLNNVCREYGVTLSQAELAFLLAQPFNTVALAGVSRVEQLTDLMGAMSLNIPLEAFDCKKQLPSFR